jgi:hypothetical protein
MCAMNTPRVTLLLAAIVILSASASAQVYEATTKSVTTRFVLRMQRQESRSASCVIVYPDHRAHYEMITALGTQVFEGPLNAESAKQVDALLQPLAAIDPRAIAHKSQFEELDLVIVNVMTPRGLSNLQFSDSSTRKPFKAAMDPTLKWLAGAHKGLATLPESKKDNCVPGSGATDAAPKQEPPLMSRRQAQVLSQHLLFRADTFNADEGIVNESCVAVAPDGRYRYETRTTSEAGSVTSAKLFEGSVDPAELARLREILAEPALRNSTHNPEPSNGVRARNSESIELAIPREDHLQRLRFFANSGLGYREPTPAAQVMVTDTDTKLLKPVRSWLKESIEKRKGSTAIAGGKPNHCSVAF